MKYSIALIAAGASFAIAQSPSDLAPCGQLCVNNMIAIATSEFGCTTGDIACYCGNANFGYGIADCSNDVCDDQADAARAVEYGSTYCAGANGGGSPTGGDASSTGGSDSSATATGEDASATGDLTASATGTDGGAGGIGASTAITTSALVATITSGSDTITTTTGFTTVYSSVSGGEDATPTDASGSASASASSLASSISEEISSAIESATDAANSSGGSEDTTSTSTGGAAIQTAAPLLGAAGIAALLFI